MTANYRFKQISANLAATLHRCLGSCDHGRLGILVYHSVSPEFKGLPERPFNVTPAKFRAQLSGLLDRGFQFIPLAAALAARHARKPLPARCVVLTFDDAYESVYHHAYPVMRELKVPATAFMSTAYFDSPDPFPFDRWANEYRQSVPSEELRPLRRVQCDELIDSGLVELGAHMHTHRNLRDNVDEFRQDLEVSLAAIRELRRQEEVSFAFPFGREHLGFAGGVFAETVRNSGATCALTTDCGLIDPLQDDEFTWGRFNAYESDSARTLAAKLAGWYAWIPSWQVRLERALGRGWTPVSSVLPGTVAETPVPAAFHNPEMALATADNLDSLTHA